MDQPTIPTLYKYIMNFSVHLSSLQDTVFAFVFFMKKKSVQFPTPLCESTNRAEALKYSLKFFFDIMNRKQMEEHCWKT